MGQRLLVVDSDRNFLAEHQPALSAAFDLEVLSSPEGAQARLESGLFGAVLICVEVAENKGYALCSSVRKSPLTAEVKVALISAKATEEEYRRHQSLKGHADLYLHKPIATPALVSALSQMVPARADADNPLGDLSGELGDDWLESLKVELETGAPPPPPTSQTVAIPMDLLRQAGIDPLLPVSRTVTAPIQVMSAEPAGRTVALSPEQVRASLDRPEETARILALEAQARQAAEELAAARAESDGLRAEAERLRAETDSLRGETEGLRAETGSLRGETEGLRVQTEGLRGETEALRAELEQARLDLSGATRNLDEGGRLQAELEQLQARLKEREASLQRTREDFDALQRSHDSVTQNLDDLERRQQEAEELRAKLARAEEALARLEQSSAREGEGNESLKNQLRQSIEEHHELLHQVEELNTQMAEKNQRVIGLMKDRDRLQQQALETETFQNRAAALEREQQERQSALDDLQGRHGELERSHGELNARHEEARREAEAAAGRIQALEGDLQARDADLQARTGELDGLRAELESERARLADLGGELQARIEAFSHLEAVRDRLLTVCSDLERQLGQAVSRHETERLELLEEHDRQTTEATRLQEELDGARQDSARLGSELQDLQSTLADRNDRLGALSALLAEAGERIQRGSDLART